MLEKLVRSCEVCGDERTFAASAYVEKHGLCFFRYTCETCNEAHFDLLAPGQTVPVREPKPQTVIFEVIG